MIDQF
jgi:hypothetical protein